MTVKPYQILILCTGNSARSIMAEAIINALGQGRLLAYSAGSQPAGKVHPLALEKLQSMAYPSAHLRSKSWDEFASPGAPKMDLIITVCDNAAGEVCPIWPGHPATAHWGYPDPSEGDGSDAEKLQAFRKTMHAMKRRLELLIGLPKDKLEKEVLQGTARDLAKS